MFADLPNPFVATRYHSLVILPESLPSCLEVSSWVQDSHGNRIIMGVRHKEFPVEGWQFHPESFLTEPGPTLLARFLKWSSPPASVPASAGAISASAGVGNRNPKSI
jgi:anthranilate synthase component 2